MSYGFTKEFNKKFRATDDFKTSISEEKIESFGKVLQKFFDNEREDYKKDVETRTSECGKAASISNKHADAVSLNM